MGDVLGIPWVIPAWLRRGIAWSGHWTAKIHIQLPASIRWFRWRSISVATFGSHVRLPPAAVPWELCDTLPHVRGMRRYAAVATLVNIGTTAALDVVDRQKVLGFLRQMCVPSDRGGGIAVHAEGEVDIRSCYLALATAYMLNMDLGDLASRSNLVNYVQRCQTYEVHPSFLLRIHYTARIHCTAQHLWW